MRANILISVLWAIVIMSVLVLGLNSEARSDVERTIMTRDRSHAYWFARAGAERAKYEFASAKLESDPGQQPKLYYEFEFEGGYAKCLLISNAGKMSINAADRELWLQLFRTYGLDEMGVDKIVDAVFDWRDQDDIPRLNGAEDEFYQTRNPPYSPRNGLFQSVEELLLVRGVTEDMYYGYSRNGVRTPGLSEILSASGPNLNRFDINSCPKGILMAFLQLDEAQADAIIEARNEKLFDNIQEPAALVPPESTEFLTRFFMTYRGTQFTIKSTGFVYNSPARYTVEDEVRYTGGDKLYINLSHKDFSMDHVDERVEEPNTEAEKL